MELAKKVFVNVLVVIIVVTALSLLVAILSGAVNTSNL